MKTPQPPLSGGIKNLLNMPMQRLKKPLLVLIILFGNVFFLLPNVVLAQECCVKPDGASAAYERRNDCNEDGWSVSFSETCCNTSQTMDKCRATQFCCEEDKPNPNQPPAIYHGQCPSFYKTIDISQCQQASPPASPPEAPKFYKPRLEINIPGITFSDIKVEPGKTVDIPWIAQYIVGLYRFSLAIAGILAVFMVMFGGFLWLTAAGNQATIGRGKEYLKNAVIGVVILYSAYLILAEINPSLVDLKKMNILVLGGGAGCGSWGTEAGIDKQCASISPTLSQLLTCLQSTLGATSLKGTKFFISSIGGAKGTHSKNSCHYGGRNCTDGSYAVDILDSDETPDSFKFPEVATAIVEAAKTCKADYISGPGGQFTYQNGIYNSKNSNESEEHQSHVHISVGNKKCQCDGAK